MFLYSVSTWATSIVSLDGGRGKEGRGKGREGEGREGGREGREGRDDCYTYSDGTTLFI